LAKIAPQQTIELQGDYWAAVSRNVLALGQQFGRKPQAEQALKQLQQQADQAREQIAGNPLRTLVLLHNEGRLVPNEQPLIYQTLGAPRTLPAPPAQAPGAPRARPAPADLEQVAAQAPEVIFIVDRSAAIGGAALDVADLAKTPLANTPAAKNQAIYYLEPSLWYLSGGGLLSTSRQIEQVQAAYR